EFFFDFKNNFLDLISEEVNENTIQGNKKSNKKPKKSKPVMEDLDEDQTIKIVGFNKAEDDYLEILEGTSSFNAIDDSTSFRNSEFGEIKRDLEPEKKTEKLELNKLDLEKPPIDKNLEKTYAENISFFDKENIFKDYKFPSTKLLNKLNQKEGSQKKVIQNAETLEKTLADFGVSAKVSQATIGPSITRFEIQPSAGVKVSKIVNLTDDIALSLAAKSIRVEAPIPGKSAIGIEVPNEKSLIVTLREVLESNEFKEFDSKVGVALGKDISGNPVIFDISKMPHLLIAGSTGSGKSVCINTLIASILYKAKPDEVKLLLIDPKVVELANYNGIPHLLIPVVTDPKKASGALNWAVNEMNRRYQLFASNGVKDINSYNEKIETKLPRIVIIIDELADLMMSSANDVEDYICRLAQMARACGMHLIVATQRPSVDVITGVIKANIPSRIAFAVSSQTDSRTILDMGGAEKLLGRGDMLFYPLGSSKPQRIQGAFMSEKESEDVIEFVKSQVSEGITYEEEIIESLSKSIVKEDDDDEFLSDAINFVIESEQASSSMLQRKFKIGFNRAARLIDTMENRGIVGPSEGSKPRKVLIAKEDLESEF
ncbi:MAG: DNA translocase FtsK, partial [Peptostreptococcaceae bacterium]